MHLQLVFESLFTFFTFYRKKSPKRLRITYTLAETIKHLISNIEKIQKQQQVNKFYSYKKSPTIADASVPLVICASISHTCWMKWRRMDQIRPQTQSILTPILLSKLLLMYCSAGPSPADAACDRRTARKPRRSATSNGASERLVVTCEF